MERLPTPKQFVRGLEWVAWTGLVALVASAGSTAIGASLALEGSSSDLTELYAPPTAEAEAEPSRRQRVGELDRDAEGRVLADAIVSRNPFCPSCRPVEDSPAADGPAPSELPLALIATFESSDPAESLATIHDTDAGVLGPFEVGELVRPGVVLHAVERGRVVLRAGEQLSYLELPRPEEQTPAKPKREKDDKAKKKSGRTIPGAEDAITCDKDHCTVEREFVDKLIRQPGLLAKQARIVPAVRDGETQGFKFYGIRSGSLPKLLGVKNGDLLMAVNGVDLDSMDRAMSLYTKLRRASHLSVRIQRKGKIVTKEIDIQ